MPRWRVGEGGIRVVTPHGAAYHLPPGTVIEEIPHQYQGTLEVVEWDRIDGYEDKRLQPPENKAG